MNFHRIYLAPADDGGAAASAPAAAPAAAASAPPAAPAAAAAPAASPAAAPASADLTSIVGDEHKPAAEGEKVEGAVTDDGEKKDDAAEDAPVEYEDFKLPEGSTVDPEVMTGFKAILAEAKVPQETAQKLVDLYGDRVRAIAEAPYEAWRNTQRDWQAAIKADAEIGGANFEPMKAEIAKAITALGGKEAKAVREAFAFTGAGNNPEIVRFLFRASQAVNEGRTRAGGNPTPDASKQPAKALYPTLT